MINEAAKKTSSKITGYWLTFFNIGKMAYDRARVDARILNRPLSLGRALSTTGVFLIYAVTSAVYLGLPIAGNLSENYIGRSSDPNSFMWWLYWWPYAIFHSLNPFITKAVWAPEGFNLAWSTGIPGLSLFAAPITFTLGPVAAYNILVFLSPVLAALAAYILIHHLTGSFWPSLIGGYLFGFSSYEISQSLGHLNLTFILFIPLVVYLVVLLFENKIRPVKFVALMVLLLSFQFLVSVEIFATMTVFGILVLVVALIIFPQVRRTFLSRGKMIAAAYGLAALLMSPYLYYMFAFGHPGSPIYPPSAYSTDLLNLLFPTSTTLIGHSQFNAVASTFIGDAAEDGAYIGLPLIIIIFIYISRSWRSRVGKVLAISLALVIVSSLGPVLHTAGIETIKLPWYVAGYIPLLNQALPARFMAYAFLIIALIAAFFLADKKIDRVARYGLIVLSIVLLIPVIPSICRQSATATPAFFSQGIYKSYISKGENVLVIPYGYNGASMLWQTETGLYFNMAGGYVGVTPPSFADWPIVNTFYSGNLIPDYAEQLKEFLGSHNVGAVIVEESYSGEFSQLFDSLDVGSQDIGGVTLYQVPPEIISTYHNATAAGAIGQANLAQFNDLYTAAGDFLHGGGQGIALYPSALEDGGYLSNSYGGYPGDSSAANWTQYGGWLGSWNEDVAIGVNGSYDEVLPVIEAYRGDSKVSYFPYPATLTDNPDKSVSGLLLMVFSKDQIVSDANKAAK